MKSFVVGAFLALALVSGAVAEDARNVNIVNETGYGIKFLGFNNPGDDDWSDNELGSVLRNRGSVYVKVQHRRRRMRMEFKDRMGGPGLSRRAVERRGFVQDQHAAAALQQGHRHDVLLGGMIDRSGVNVQPAEQIAAATSATGMQAPNA
jgi:hypothetical protein